jgi:hypothetical protein
VFTKWKLRSKLWSFIIAGRAKDGRKFTTNYPTCMERTHRYPDLIFERQKNLPQ